LTDTSAAAQHLQSGLIVVQSEQSTINDNRWPVCADVSRWDHSPNSPNHGFYRPQRQYYSRFRAVSVFDETSCSSITLLDQYSLSHAWIECGN